MKAPQQLDRRSVDGIAPLLIVLRGASVLQPEDPLAAPAAALHAALEAGGLVGELLARVLRLVEVVLLLGRDLPRPLAGAAASQQRNGDEQQTRAGARHGRRVYGRRRLRHPEEVR